MGEENFLISGSQEEKVPADGSQEEKKDKSGIKPPEVNIFEELNELEYRVLKRQMEAIERNYEIISMMTEKKKKRKFFGRK